MTEWISVEDRLPEENLSDKEKSTRKQIRVIASDGKTVYAATRMRYRKDSPWFWKAKVKFYMYFPPPPKQDP